MPQVHRPHLGGQGDTGSEFSFLPEARGGGKGAEARLVSSGQDWKALDGSCFEVVLVLSPLACLHGHLTRQLRRCPDHAARTSGDTRLSLEADERVPATSTVPLVLGFPVHTEKARSA